MKKLLIIFFVASALCVQAQQYESLHVEDFPGVDMYFYCFDNDIPGLIIYGETGCNAHWFVYPSGGGDLQEWNNIDSIVIYNPHKPMIYFIQYDGCEINVACPVAISFLPMDPFVEPIIWKRTNDYVDLYGGNDASYYQWSTGETEQGITVSEPGTYSVTLTNDCGSATYSVEVRDNVELYRATCDLVSNLNQVTWNTTPEQAEYVSAVKVYRNNQLVGTAPYMDGVFTDEIGSENTQWQYHIVAVSVEGDDCPIPSYWKRTIHLDCVQDSQGRMILQWTPYAEESPSKNEVTAYGIYDVVNGVPNHVIDVGNFTNVYAYNPADFHGYGAVAAVFAEDSLKRSDGFEKLAFSNRTKQMLGIEDIVKNSIRVYPNPTDGEFTVEGVSDLIIYNILGQVVTTSHTSENVHKFSLGTGIYFIKSNEGLVKKVVVE